MKTLQKKKSTLSVNIFELLEPEVYLEKSTVILLRKKVLDI